VRWLRRLQIRPENYPSRRSYVLALAIYCALGVPLILLSIFGPSTAHIMVTLGAGALFAVLDFGVLRRRRAVAPGS
jgi:hypothetical protein